MKKIPAWLLDRTTGTEFVSMFDNKRAARSYARQSGFRINKLG